ncbi:MAG: PAS domain S-box protein, partial [Chloroflexi bacterium]|nr:PAS domain S-box protein [Chloroflexota bacterium]
AFISDPGKCALYANKALADVYGLTIEQIQRLDFKEYVKPSLYSRIVEQDHIVVSENRILKIEETIPLESGLSEWLTYKFPIEHEDGHTLIGGFGIDITERKQTEEALRESEAKFNTAFQLLPISSVITTIPDGRIVNANNTYLANLGLSPEEVLGKTSQEILVIENPEDIDEIGQMLEKSGRVANKEITIVDKDGRRYIGLYSAEMITVEGKPHLLAVTNDITERRQAQDALNERFKELRCLYGITEIVAREGITIDDIYQEALELLLTSWQYPEITCAKIAIGDKEFHTENFRDSEWNQSADITVHGITVGKLEVAYLEAMQDRRENPFLDEERLLIDAVAERLGRIIEHKQAEEQLRQTMEGLEHSNKELEQFAYIVSHDLQEPLRMVASYVQLLEKRYKDQLDQDANDFINFAVDGTIRMQQMILDILEYSRVGTKGREFESVDLNSVLSKVVTNLGGQIEDSGALITHDELPELFAEETQMLQLLQNLIGNAIKFRSEETPRIHVSGAEDNGSWVISVKDNGIGILHEYHDKIFAVFRKLHAVGKYPGSGIGLAIVAKIVERHGGKIWVDSEPGKGSTFYFAIPKKRSAA